MRQRMFWVGGVLAVAATVSGFAAKPSAFANQSRPMAAEVTILAVSSSSRQSFAGNQEIYLADLRIKGEMKGERQFVRLIDQYPGFGLPLRTSLLKSQTVFKMQVTREPECDLPGSQIYLRQEDAVIFNGSVRDSLASHQADPIPCYRTLHQTIVISKK